MMLKLFLLSTVVQYEIVVREGEDTRIPCDVQPVQVITCISIFPYLKVEGQKTKPKE